jgi:membrane protein DedA with SNARE-associated domain
MAELSLVFEHLEPWIHDYGAAAIFLILTLESFGVPVPGESLLIFAAILAERGEIAFPIWFLSAWCGAVTGDNIWYLIGRVLGQKLLQRYGTKVGLNPNRLRKVEATFARYGPATVGFARFFNVLRQLNGVIAGSLEMNWWRFFMFNALGGALWVTVWTVVGFYLGTYGSEISSLVRQLGFFGAILVSVAVSVVLTYAFIHRNHRWNDGGS